MPQRSRSWLRFCKVLSVEQKVESVCLMWVLWSGTWVTGLFNTAGGHDHTQTPAMHMHVNAYIVHTLYSCGHCSTHRGWLSACHWDQRGPVIWLVGWGWEKRLREDGARHQPYLTSERMNEKFSLWLSLFHLQSLTRVTFWGFIRKWFRKQHVSACILQFQGWHTPHFQRFVLSGFLCVNTEELLKVLVHYFSGTVLHSHLLP